MRGKKKFFILVMFIYGIRESSTEYISSLYGEPVGYTIDSFIVYSSGFVIKIDSFYNGIPLIMVRENSDSNRMSSKVYPCAELLYLIKKEFPEFYKKIEKVELRDDIVLYVEGKKVIMGLGRFRKKIRYLLSIRDKDKDKIIDLRLLSFIGGY
jgi:hypothetical protein